MVSEGYGPISGEKRPILGHIFDRGYIIDHFFKTGFEEKYAGLGGETVGTKTTQKKTRHDCGIFFGNFGSVLGGEMGSRPKSVSPERRTLSIKGVAFHPLNWGGGGSENALKQGVSILTFRKFPTKNGGSVGGSLEIFNLDWKFQPRRAILNFFNLWALRGGEILGKPWE